MSDARTLFAKLWDAHVIDLGSAMPAGVDLLAVDRHLLHDLAGVISLEEMAERHLHTAFPDLTIGILDHTVSTAVGRNAMSTPISQRYLPAMSLLCAEHGIPLLPLDGEGQGIVHVVAPEAGMVLPGLTVVCGDSHTTTHGAFGALAWGIGSSEVTHVLVTQTIRQTRPQTQRIRLAGSLKPGLRAKDVILKLIGDLGVAGGNGTAIEFQGPVVDAMSMEERMVLCNMTLEMGAKVALIAPDEVTFAYLKGRPFAPEGGLWDKAISEWRGLKSDPRATFDIERSFDCSDISYQVTWGTTPEHVVGVDSVVPQPSAETDAPKRRLMELALDYMGLEPGRAMSSIPVDWVFIGSCAGGRLEDLRIAAEIVRGRHIADGVTGWVVPGSAAVRARAEEEGLDRLFQAAGFDWRQSGCSLCSAANGETVPAGQRCISTSNRNFVGRQGPGARTHIAGPAVAAASALAGYIAQPD
ncbi:3-isopropylmalate dehydratase large subunit [Devosia sp. A369]